MDGAQFDMFGEPPKPPKRKLPALPEGKDRLFFALSPDSAAVEAITQRNAGLRARHGLTGRPRPNDILHVTLRHVADTVGPPPEVVDALKVAASRVRVPAFDVTLAGAMRFAGSRAFVLLAQEALNPALMAFQKTLCEQLDQAGAGWRVGGAGFTPHLTLSYEDRDVSEPIEPISWTAREFVLVHSLIGQTRHVPLARFALG